MAMATRGPARLAPALVLVLILSLSVDPAGSETEWPPSESSVERLLERTVERAMERVAERVMERVVERALDRALERARLKLNCANSTESPHPEPEPTCDRHPSPLPSSRAPHERPVTPACARSCRQLQRQGGDRGFPPADGVYWFTGMPVPVLCDFSHDGGGWTLLLAAVSHPGWDRSSVLGRAERSPSTERDYSILRLADGIRDLGEDAWFSYRIEALADRGRRVSGGVWLAPAGYSFTHRSASQTEVMLVTRFGDWEYKAHGLKRRMPWLFTPSAGEYQHPVLLSTSGFGRGEGGWGSLLMAGDFTGYRLSSWINPETPQSGSVLYWMRE